MKKPFLASITILVMLISVSITPSAFAVEVGPYFGFSLGTADDDILNEDDSGFKIFGGTNLSEQYGFEIAFVDLGEYVGGAISQSGLAFDLVGYFPVAQNVDIFGKVGLFLWTVDIGPFSDDGTDLTYGFGVNVGIANQMSVRAEWENFTDISGGDVSLVSAGLTFNF